MQRDAYPALRAHPELVYLDHAATGLMTDRVHRAVGEALLHGGTAGRSGHLLGHRATSAYEAARAAVAGWMGVATGEIVFTPSATAALNLVAAGWGRRHLLPGDRILVTGLEHHANLLPWRRIAAETGARIDTVGLTARGDLDLADLERLLALGPRVLAMTHVSNVTGGVVDLAAVTALVRARTPECIIVVDGCQAAPHLVPDETWRDVDFYVLSGHKLGAPTGLGAVRASAERWTTVDPTLFGGGMVAGVDTIGHRLADAPWRFEAGTPPHVAAIGLAHALDEPPTDTGALLERAVHGLDRLDGVHVVGDPARRVGLVAFAVDGHHAHDVATTLAESGIAVRSGYLCAEPTLRRLGHEGVVRASFGPCNDAGDVALLLSVLEELTADRRRTA